MLIIIPILLSVAFLTLLERKILALIQRRRGPNVVGFFGLLQPLSDGFKLFLKELIIPIQASQFVFLFAPFLSLFISLFCWSVVPFSYNVIFSDISLTMLFIFALSSLNVYSIIIAGWSSNSKYAFLGCLRSAAQMISYEVSLGLLLINIFLFVGSFNLIELVYFQQSIWFCFPFLPIFIMYFITCLAETNRSPFDLPEAEAELVSGYNVEYSAISFAFFFIAEYSNIILMCFLVSLMFLGGWFFFFSNFIFLVFKVLFLLYLFVFVRAILPRYRYDQLMQLGWKFFLPIAVFVLFFYSSIFVCFDLV